MSTDTNNNVRSRSENRSKRKKTNIILNGLIILVIALIVFVSYSIFKTKDDNNAEKQSNTNAAKTEETAASGMLLPKQTMTKLPIRTTQMKILQSKKTEMKSSQMEAVIRTLLKQSKILHGSLLAQRKLVNILLPTQKALIGMSRLKHWHMEQELMKVI